ncbi:MULTISPECIES: J domain-containing protein [Prauserella salsuginis group]|uniref:J domain-containing protein n=1 Tax=Prauserella salsuginis TaxID=387889 RepID=A0ABW6G7M4_9PSEU|nr:MULTISPECIES: J domain-containing protein [Prauserella salsuginis group]MCR3719550.1 DnaJ domain-containing protein [Prauserella flava]
MDAERRDDPYVLLGVPRGADLREITAAYRRRVRQLHPDTAAAHGAVTADGGVDSVGGGAEQLAAVVAAYELLRSRLRRCSGPESRRPTAAVDDRVHPVDRQGGVSIPVRVHNGPMSRTPNLRAGPVRRHRD